jgi:hypothetical protein
METTLRKADRLVLDVFKNLVIISEEGTVSKVPVIYGTREKLRARAEFTAGSCIKKIALPIVALHRKDIHQAANASGRHTDLGTWVPDWQEWLLDYHVVIETLFQEDMNQILEQIMLPFSPTVEFKDDKVKKLYLKNIVSNESEERGDGMRVLSYEFLMQAEIVLKQGDKNAPQN